MKIETDRLTPELLKELEALAKKTGENIEITVNRPGSTGWPPAPNELEINRKNVEAKYKEKDVIRARLDTGAIDKLLIKQQNDDAVILRRHEVNLNGSPFETLVKQLTKPSDTDKLNQIKFNDGTYVVEVKNNKIVATYSVTPKNSVASQKHWSELVADAIKAVPK